MLAINLARPEGPALDRREVSIVANVSWGLCLYITHLLQHTGTWEEIDTSPSLEDACIEPWLQRQSNTLEPG